MASCEDVACSLSCIYMYYVQRSYMYLHVLCTEILHVFTCIIYRDPTCIYM